MKKISEKQLDLLKLVFPGPIGQGMEISKAAKQLGISERAAFYRLKTVRKNFPDFWDKYQTALKVMQRQRLGLKNCKISSLIINSFVDDSNFEETF